MPIPKITKQNDPAVLLSKIKQEFPSLSWSNYEYVDKGWDHEVIILDKELVFRFPVNPDYLKLLKREIKVLKLLKPLVNVRMPSYEYVARDYSFAGYKYIDGKVLSLDEFNDLDDTDQLAIATQLASFLSALHNQDTIEYENLGIDITPMKDEQKHVRQQTSKYLTNVLTQEDMAEVTKILESVDKLINKELPQVFLHGDIYSSHLLWDMKNKELGVIDFSDMNIGDPAFDFAELFEYGRAFVKKVYDLYSGQKDSSFINRAWTYQCWVGVFMMIDHFETKKTTFEVARQTFDRVKSTP